MPQFKIIYITKMANLKLIFPLLFFEHGYLTWCKTYTYMLFNMDKKHSDLEKVSQICYLGPSFHFRAKRRVTFVILL